jgi:uncharacterized protein YpuA (DUF1002 family)
MQDIYIGILTGIILSLTFMIAIISVKMQKIVKERQDAASLQQMVERELRYWRWLSENECNERRVVQGQLNELNLMYLQVQDELEQTLAQLANAEQRVVSTTQELQIVQQQLVQTDAFIVSRM